VTLEEKMVSVEKSLNFLAEELGDYAVRRAISRWKRRVLNDRYRVREQERRRLARLFRSVWLAAVPKAGGEVGT
jgi:hypothetical protein